MSQASVQKVQPRGLWEHLADAIYWVTATVLKATFRLLWLFLDGGCSAVWSVVRRVFAKRTSAAMPVAGASARVVAAAQSVAEQVVPAGVSYPGAAAVPVTATFTRTVMFDKGFGAILLWFFVPENRVKRTVKLYDPELIQRCGWERHELEDALYSGVDDIEKVEADSVKLARAVLKGQKQVRRQQLATVPAAVRAASAVAAMAPATPVEVAAAPQAAVVLQSVPSPQKNSGLAPRSGKRCGRSESESGGRPQTYVGKLLNAGVMRRTIVRNQRPKVIHQYGVTVDVNGASVNLYGVDLDRALSEVGAEIGNRVRIDYLGRTHWTDENGQPAWKNGYNAAVL